MTETQTAMIILLATSISTFLAASAHCRQGHESNLQEKVFQHLVTGFATLGALFAILTIVDGFKNGAPFFASLGFGLFIAVPCFAVSLIPAFATSHIVDKWGKMRPNNIRLEATLLSPVAFALMLYAFGVIWRLVSTYS
jgi:hypothetical protein